MGANGSGKSCLLEAIGVLGACASGAVDDQALLRRGVRPGVPELYKSSFADERIAPKISLRGRSKSDASYHAYITNSTKDPSPYWKFGNESIEYESTSIASRGPKINASALGLSVPLENTRSITTLARASVDTPSPVRAFLDALEDYAIFSPVTPVLRAIIPDSAPRSPVGLYGGRLAEAVASLATQTRGKAVLTSALVLIDWAQKISTAEPSRRLLSPSVPTSRYVVEFRDRFMAKRRNVLSGYDASEGALYILQSLNPRAARSLTKTFSEEVLRNGRQVFLTTHNPLVLDGLNLGDERIRLFTVARDRKGCTQVRRVPVRDFAALKKKHGEFAVSRLWVEGRLGGMPNV